MYELYSTYWRQLAAWAGDSLIKQQVTILAIPLIIQLTLGTFFTLADLGKWRKIREIKFENLFKRDIQSIKKDISDGWRKLKFNRRRKFQLTLKK